MMRVLVLAVGLACASTADVAVAQAPARASKGAPTESPKAGADLSVLTGAWSRPDGGYLIVIKSVGTNGQLEAMYFNPKPLPFAKAQASRVGTMLRVDLELQAGGYAGSTYALEYDPASDRLKGVYFQAVAKQKFEVYFVRK